MSEVLKFKTLEAGISGKNAKKFCVFCKNNSILRPFWIKSRFEKPILSSAKRAQNKQKRKWRAQARLLDVLSNDIMRKAKKISQILLAIGDRLFVICRAEAINCYGIV